MQRHGHGAASRSRGNAWGVATAVAVAAGLGAPAAWAQTVVDRAAPAVEDRQPVASERARELARTVTIRRDAYGVPHVSAPTDAGCVFGFLYAQAEDYFWQIEDSYLRAIGRAAEVYGEGELPADLVNRALGIGRLSHDEYAAASPAGKALFDAAAEGLNWFLDTHPEVRPRLITRFEGWHVPAFRRFMLYQSFIYRKSGLAPREILAAVKEVRADGDGPVGLLPATLDHVARLAEADAEADLLAAHVGSNMWAVAPRKSASGKALMFINPHQPFFGPGQWYEGHLTSAEGWNLLGACFFGSPFPTLGHNEHLAWSHTVNEPDIADVWEIAVDPQDPARYRHGDGSRALESWTDTIGVLTDGAVVPRTFRFTKTHHGPIVAVRAGKPLALRLAKFEEGGTLEQWQAMGKARNVAEFKEALAHCDVPMFNCLVADSAGEIFFVYNGAIPKRDPAFDWTRPVDGADPRTDWQGYHTLDELPQLANPTCGFLQNCNQGPLTTVPHGRELAAGATDENPAAARFPKYMIGERDRDNGRARISRRILGATEPFDFDAWARAGFDTRVIEAEARVPELVAEYDAVKKTDAARAEKLGPAVEALRTWDCVSTVESVPMTLFVLTFDRVMQMVQKMDLLNSPRLRALEATVADLEKDFGTWQVKWGEINRLQRIHGSEIDMEGRGAFSDDEPSLPVAGSPGPVGIVFNFYTRPQAGQKRRYGVAGHSYVGVVELGDGIRARTVLQFGQSGDPQSPHWFDQAPLYAAGEYKPSLFTADEIDRHAGPAYHPGEPRPAPHRAAAARP
ncbi:MAG: penicillin acylase family protein [Planctomycetes bacterium]|nr:penicillin acylase family protein [Planctomycetota bacterium]